ncbi:kinesin family member 22 [Capronia coronata CBS 617.96]|uniref:Kinesin-like protein KIF22 n=1 Tax=Capronia coronata CBS 617.96 TaxID=1182541 RepID=W9YQ93_9EURO|nr:kinesin family member 22 [Capronia coronata CBS 617.96]EXJ94733.1 kinesin family member 22 [Capronia coronata CBS 617.96]
MSVRVVARIRPLLQAELEKDQIVTSHIGPDGTPTMIKIPNPKNLAEEFSFQFNSVYEQSATQQEIYDAEVAPTVKHLFLGYDVTLFAYGSTGTGKTHTMRGGKSLADRGMIPRLLSSIYRKSRTIEKSSNGETNVAVSMSYYEIYNDRVFDLFDAPEKRTATGLPIREAEGGKTVVVGLTEVPCRSLKEFEALYDKANANRSTGATKLNSHSSRSHAILCVKVTITSPTETRVSTASAIDLAGSEDNRRTGNGKDRMVESASINKSLFVLAQCVEAISKKQPRIPYRESKMTRILSLGQNNGFTVMILNLAPVKSYHLDTLSSLNFANRTKKIEVREVENEPIFKGPPRQTTGGALAGGTMQRQPLRPLSNGINVNLTANRDATTKNEKPPKAFAVYSDRSRPTAPKGVLPPKSSPLKRNADNSLLGSSRPSKISRPTPNFIRRGPEATTLSKASIETLVEQKVSEILAARALNAPDPAPTKTVSEEVQRRLDSIEKRLAGQDGERAEGLSYLFMAKQHQARGEDGSALKMYELARPYFPDNEKLQSKIDRLREKLATKRVEEDNVGTIPAQKPTSSNPYSRERRDYENDDGDESYHDEAEESAYHDSEDDDDNDDGGSSHRARPRKQRGTQGQGQRQNRKARTSSPDPLTRHNLSHADARVYTDEQAESETGTVTPRTRYLLDVINSRDVSKIRTLSGLGAKRAEGIIEYLNAEAEAGAGSEAEDDMPGNNHDRCFMLRSWTDLTRLRGVGKKTLETMREAVLV